MLELWFAIVALMLALYVVLDGYDLGAGALHLMVARTNDERRTVLAAIGPFWGANEVWLIAAGGALFTAFPRVLAAGLSGFYLAIFMLLWCLILRGVAIEFRSHLGDGLWRGFWDATLVFASALLAVLFGAALGNVIRGVPLTPQGWFQLTLFTSFQPRGSVGILDWYTVLAGVFSLVALAGHGAAFLAWRATGLVHERSRRLARRLYLALAVLWPLTTIATHAVNPELLPAILGRPFAILGLLLAASGIVCALVLNARGRFLGAFLGSCAYLAGMLTATAACLFPVMLRSIGDGALSITAYTGGGAIPGLRTATRWWMLGFPLALAYFATVFRINRGKVVAAREGDGP
jgi:cytochrome d ubiquinol oxidase subunit II